MENLDNKVKGLLCYLLSILGGIIFLFCDKSATKNIKIHAAQSLVIFGGYIILSIVLGILNAIVYIPLISSLSYIVYIVCLIVGMVKGYKEDENPELPVIGDIAKSLFAKQIGE